MAEALGGILLGGGQGGRGGVGVGGPASALLDLGLTTCLPNPLFAGFQIFRSRTV